MFRKIKLSLTPEQKLVRAAKRREYRETPSRKSWPVYELENPQRLDFHRVSAVDWSLLDTDDRFGGQD